MKEMFTAYHVVTDRPMQVGQRITFDAAHHTGVYNRVMEKLPLVEEIYEYPERYEGVELEHHTSVALRELALEEVRRETYPDYPSRMGCLYVSETLEESERWAAFFASLGRPTYHIVKLKICGNRFAGDATKCFDGTASHQENVRLARCYWENVSNPEDEPPIKEILVDGDIEVVEIIQTIMKNV